MADIFISYETSEGLELARCIQQKFKKEFYINAFVKTDNMKFGKKSDNIIKKEIEQCK